MAEAIQVEVNGKPLEVAPGTTAAVAVFIRIRRSSLWNGHLFCVLRRGGWTRARPHLSGCL